MHRQASFIPTFFPENAEADFFYFPSYEEEDLGNPVLGAGTLWAITEDSPASHALIEFLQTPIAHEVWMAQSGFLTPIAASTWRSSRPRTQRAMNEILLGDHVPLRRLRPDAGRDRRRRVLDRHGRLHLRRIGRRRGRHDPGSLGLDPVKPHIPTRAAAASRPDP